jgi:hypothetical protein
MLIGTRSSRALHQITLIRIPSKPGIGCNNGKILLQALRDQNAVKWIAVLKWQSFQALHMIKCDLENQDSVCFQFCGQVVADRSTRTRRIFGTANLASSQLSASASQANLLRAAAAVV